MITKTIGSIYRVNLGVKRDERVIIFTDRISPTEILQENDLCRRERLRDIALLTAEIGKAFTKKVIYHEYAATGSHGAEPPEELWEIAFGKKTVSELKKYRLLKLLLKKEINDNGIKKAEAIIAENKKSAVNGVIALSNYSTSHTRFRDFLTRVCGCRYASMPIFDVSMLESSMNVDWKRLSKRTKSVAKIVNTAEAIEIKTPNGTHITMSKKGRQALSDDGILTKQGSFGNLPAGEVFLAPVEGSANGRLVLEWAPTRELKSPITLIVEDGIVKDVIGDEPYADYLMAKLNEREENRNIAELGMGTNDMAKRPDNILESEKILGTVHIALGDNSSFGGKVKTPFHQDFVFFKPMVILKTKDGSEICLLREGVLTE
ncbi:MAG: aminopeptidase [Nitrospirae bacterium]|nr:aminopeptidase [Nitrospirota bacterium]MDA8213738.1 aminopeptidase [Nitrospiraceae bacterium]